MRDFFKKVANFGKNHPVAILSVLTATFVAFAATQAWGPDRPMFTMESPAPYITFNSISNNPVIGGSETDFVGIREKGTNAKWTNEMKVQPGKEYQVRLYVHNDASENLNLVAENVLAKFNLPTTTGRSIQVSGALSASNAKPGQVHDAANFVGDQDFNLAYVAGSAIYENNVFKNGVKLPDSIMTSTGARLGYDKMDGRIPGCMKYSGVVTITVRPQFAESNGSISLNKTVRKEGEKTWSENVNVNPGETVEFQIHAKNTGSTTIDNLMIRDVLPAKGFTYVQGSAKLLNQSNPKGLAISENFLKDSAANVGKYLPKGDAYIRFKAKVAANDQLPVCGPNVLTNLAQASNQKIVQNDTASVTVNKTCTPPPVPPKKDPVFACEFITKKLIRQTSGTNGKQVYGSETYEFNTSYKVENVDFKGVRYTVKNSKGEIVKEQTVNGGSKFELTLQSYVSEKYTIIATLITSAGENTGVDCQTTIETKAPEQPKTPIVTCDSIQVIKISRTRFTINVNYTVTNIQFTGIRLVIRDSNGKIVQDKTSNGGKFTIDITTSGKYTIEVIVNGKNDAKCSKEIIVEDEPKVDTPAISIVKTVNSVKKLVTPENRDFNYEITVSNTGNVDLKDVKITDRAPENIKFFSADKGQIKDNVLTYTIPTLKVGATETITIKSQALKVGTFKNIACVDTPTIPGDNDGCDSANVEVPPKENPTPEPQPTPTPTPAPTPAPTPNVPAELPRTGANFSAVLAIFSLTTAIGYYIVSLKR